MARKKTSDDDEGVHAAEEEEDAEDGSAAEDADSSSCDDWPDDKPPGDDLQEMLAEDQDGEGTTVTYSWVKQCPCLALQADACPKKTWRRHSMWAYGEPDEVRGVLCERQLWHIKRCGSHEDWRKDKSDDEIRDLVRDLKIRSNQETFKDRKKWRREHAKHAKHAKKWAGKRKWKEEVEVKEEAAEGEEAEGAAASSTVAATRLCETRGMV